jgi:hypothetical protein
VGRNYTYQFGAALKELCDDVNVKLAANCPERMKAFEHEHKGVVLGIGFDTKKLEWFLPADKSSIYK